MDPDQPVAGLGDGLLIASRASRAFRLRSPRDKPLRSFMDVLLDALGYRTRQPHQEDVSTSSTDAHKELLADTRALPVEDLLPQDVCVPAVLGEFAQYVEVHPAQRERAAPVAVDPVVQPQG
jgi:hypothetical protein